ncbi:MAG: fibronectin type III domain-containing protein [Candidatus Paceibacterota bacterium]
MPNNALANNATTTVSISSGPDIAGPIVSNIQKSDLAYSSVTINWETNESTISSYINYGITTSTYSNTLEEAYGTRNHQVSLSGLNANTVYYFQIRSTDLLNNTSTYNYDNGGINYSFVTPSTAGSQGGSVILPKIELLDIGDLEILLNNGASYSSQREIKISFRNYSDFERVRISENNGFVETAWNHVEPRTDWQLSNTDGRKTLYFQFQDNAGGLSKVIEKSIILDRISPSSPVNFAAKNSNKNIKLTWLLPSEGDVDGVRVFRSEDSFILNPLSPSGMIFEGKDENLFDFDIRVDKIYYYSAFTYDYARNYSSPAIFEIIYTENKTDLAGPAKGEQKPEIVYPDNNATEIIYNRNAESVVLETENKQLIIKPGDEIILNDDAGVAIKGLTRKTFHYLEKTSLSFVIEDGYTEDQVEGISLVFGRSLYAMQLLDDKWQAKIETPPGKNQYEIKIILYYKDKRREEILVGNALIDPYGYVYQEVVEPYAHLFAKRIASWQFSYKENRLEGVKVSLFVKSKENKWVLFDANKYNQANPQYTDSSGSFGFMVPQGVYYIEAQKDGFGGHKTESFEVKDRIINQKIKISSVFVPWWRLKENAGFVAFVIFAISGLVLSIFGITKKIFFSQ